MAVAGGAELVPQHVIEALQKTVSSNPTDLNEASAFLTQAQQTDFSGFVRVLSICLRTTDLPGFVRQQAGLQLKNVLYAKDDNVRIQHLNRWLQLPVDTRNLVKENVLSTLGTEQTRPSIAAQCVAAIACAEIPTNLWPDAIDRLMRCVTEATSSELLKESSLEALGYICQDINAAVLEAKSNEVLIAIVNGVRKEEPSLHVRAAAVNALLNSLDFTRKNFESTQERNVIMQVICEATQCPDETVRVRALQCLVRIMSLYYQHMEAYVQALFTITLQAMKCPEPNVALQGIEFWSNVAEEELNLAEMALEAAEMGAVPQLTSRHYARGAIQHIINILLELMAQQPDDADDDDEWTPCKAAAVCVSLLAQCVGDAIVQPVLPFCTHLASPNWHYKEAALMAFGSILEGPNKQTIVQYVKEALPTIVQALSDQKVLVRDTTAWCLGRILDVCGDVVVANPSLLQAVLEPLSRTLRQEPRVAANGCWAFVSLTRAVYDWAKEHADVDEKGTPMTYALSGCYSQMIEGLITTADRPDASKNNLRMAAYEALMELIKNSPADCYETVRQTTVIMLQKLESMLTVEASSMNAGDKSQLTDILALLCATLQSVLSKMRREDATEVGDMVMKGLLTIIARSQNKAGNVVEEALLAMTSLVSQLGPGFQVYVEALRPHLLQSLANIEEIAVCSAAIGLLSDMCSALEKNMTMLSDEIVQQLLTNLLNDQLPVELRIAIISFFEDIAIALGIDFQRYIQHVSQLLEKELNTAREIAANVRDEESVELLDRQIEAIVTAYTGIVQALKPAGALPELQIKAQSRELVQPYVASMLRCVELVTAGLPNKFEYTDTLIGGICGLVGDLIVLYEQHIAALLNKEPLHVLLQRGRKSKQNKTKHLALWATKELRRWTGSAASAAIPSRETPAATVRCG